MHKKYRPSGKTPPMTYVINDEIIIKTPSPLKSSHVVPECNCTNKPAVGLLPPIDHLQKRRMAILSERQQKNHMRVLQIEMAIMKEELKDLNRVVKNRQQKRRLIARLISAPSLSEFDGTAEGAKPQNLETGTVDDDASVQVESSTEFGSGSIILPVPFSSSSSSIAPPDVRDIFIALPTIEETVSAEQQQQSPGEPLRPETATSGGTNNTAVTATTTQLHHQQLPSIDGTQVAQQQQQQTQLHQQRRASIAGGMKYGGKSRSNGRGGKKKDGESGQIAAEESDFLREYPLLKTLAISLNEWMNDKWPEEEAKGATATSKRDFLKLFRECGASAARISERSLMRPTINAVVDEHPPRDLLNSLRRNMRDLLIEDPAEVRSRRQPHRLPGSDQTGLMAERAGEHQIIDGSISNDQIVGSVDRMINRMLSYTQVDHKATKQWLDKIQDRNFVELLLKSSLCRGYKPPQISLLAARSGSLSGKSVGSVATIKK